MKEKGSERRGGGGVGLANVVSKTQCASITHATENAYLSVYLHSFTLSNLRAASNQHTKTSYCKTSALRWVDGGMDDL